MPCLQQAGRQAGTAAADIPHMTGWQDWQNTCRDNAGQPTHVPNAIRRAGVKGRCGVAILQCLAGNTTYRLNLGSTAMLARYASSPGGARLPNASLLAAVKLRLTVPTNLLSLPGGSRLVSAVMRQTDSYIGRISKQLANHVRQCQFAATPL